MKYYRETGQKDLRSHVLRDITENRMRFGTVKRKAGDRFGTRT